MLHRISFEFFPPKSSDSAKLLLNEAKKLLAIAPDFYSVTFGAGGSTRNGTLETVKALKKATACEVAPHISCLGYNQQELGSLLQAYQRVGVKRLVVLRGDAPADATVTGDFLRAHELVSFIRETTNNFFQIEVAAYPEFHPLALNPQQDVMNLKLKYEAGANQAITQYFYNVDAYFYLRDECAKQKIDMPIIPGVMPIMNFDRLVKFSKMCGAEIPLWLFKRLEAYGNDLNSMRAFGVEFVANLCQRMLDKGAPGLHFYTLNHADLSLQILQSLKLKRHHTAQVAEAMV